MALDKGDISVVAYEAKLHALSLYAAQLLGFEKERIHLYVKNLNYKLQVLFVHITFAGKKFNKVSDYVKKLEEVNQ